MFIKCVEKHKLTTCISTRHSHEPEFSDLPFLITNNNNLYKIKRTTVLSCLTLLHNTSHRHISTITVKFTADYTIYFINVDTYDIYTQIYMIYTHVCKYRNMSLSFRMPFVTDLLVWLFFQNACHLQHHLFLQQT